MGKLAVRADPENLGVVCREFALPPGELENLRLSNGGEVQRVEKQDDPLPLVVGQSDFSELLTHDPGQLEQRCRAIHLDDHVRISFHKTRPHDQHKSAMTDGEGSGIFLNPSPS
jgi:hypothetical protein